MTRSRQPESAIDAGLAFMRRQNPDGVRTIYADLPRPAPLTLSRRDIALGRAHGATPPRIIGDIAFPPGGNVNRLTLAEKIAVLRTRGERPLTRDEAASLGYDPAEIAENAAAFEVPVKPARPKTAKASHFHGVPLASTMLTNADLVRLAATRLNRDCALTEGRRYESLVTKTAGGVRIDVLQAHQPGSAE